MSIALTYLAAYITEALIAYYYLSKISNKKSSNLILLLAYTISYGIQFGVSFIHNMNLNTISFITANFMLIYLCYETSIFIAFLHSMIMTIMMGFGELITNSLLGSIFFQYKVADMQYSIFIIYFLISKLFYYVLMMLIAHLFFTKNNNSFLFDKSILLLLFVPILSIFLMANFYYVCTVVELPKTAEQFFTMSSFCIILINVLIVFLYEYIQDKQNRIAQLKLEIQHETDIKQYSKLIAQQDINQKILVHDIKHHLQNIQLLQQEKDYERAEQYIANILSEPSLRHSFKPTKNKLLNLILSQYILSCEEHHIQLKIDAQNTDVDFLSSTDITSLFCNLLDNALEASKNIPESMIELKIIDKETAPITVISVTNSSRTAPKKAESGFFRTTKENSILHGYGLRSIGQIVEKYGGTMEPHYDDEKKEFHMIIAMPNNYQPSKIKQL